MHNTCKIVIYNTDMCIDGQLNATPYRAVTFSGPMHSNTWAKNEGTTSEENTRERGEVGRQEK